MKFQVNVLQRCGVRDVDTTVCKMLTATAGEELTLKCNWFGTVGKITVCSNRFVGAITGRLTK